MGDVHYLFGQPLDEADEYLASLTPFERKRIQDRNSFLEQIRRGVGRLTAAASVNWSPKRLDTELLDPDFAEAVDMMLEMRDEAVVEAAWRAAVVRGNATMIQFWLFNRRPDEWKDPRTRDAAVGASNVDAQIVAAAVAAIRQTAMAEAARTLAGVGRPPEIEGEVIEDADVVAQD